LNRFSIIILLFITCCSSEEKVSELYREGVRAYHEKKFDEAERFFQSVIEQDDGFLNAYLMLGKIYYYNRDFEKSLDVLEKVIERDSNHTGALYWKSRVIVMLDQNITDEPINLLKKVLETDSSHIPARLLLALLYEKKSLYKEALHQYVTIIDEEENLINARGNLAILYMRLGLTGRAKIEIGKAFKICEIAECNTEKVNHIKREIEQW